MASIFRILLLLTALSLCYGSWSKFWHKSSLSKLKEKLASKVGVKLGNKWNLPKHGTKMMSRRSQGINSLSGKTLPNGSPVDFEKIQVGLEEIPVVFEQLVEQFGEDVFEITFSDAELSDTIQYLDFAYGRLLTPSSCRGMVYLHQILEIVLTNIIGDILEKLSEIEIESIDEEFIFNKLYFDHFASDIVVLSESYDPNGFQYTSSSLLIEFIDFMLTNTERLFKESPDHESFCTFWDEANVYMNAQELLQITAVDLQRISDDYDIIIGEALSGLVSSPENLEILIQETKDEIEDAVELFKMLSNPNYGQQLLPNALALLHFNKHLAQGSNAEITNFVANLDLS